jgi:hypothetical protein
VVVSREWELRAACRYEDPDLWFSHQHRGEAIAICQSCPVREECLDAALVREAGVPKTYREGIVAGLSGPQRWRLARQRNIAAPPPPKEPKPKYRRRWKIAPCGTDSAYKRHVRNKEPVDEACRIAHAAADRRLRSTGTTKVLTDQ